MGTTPEYAWLSVFISLASFIMACIHVRWSTIHYRTYHDDKAALLLGKAVALVVISFGLAISSMGLLVDEAILSVTGLSIARGAMFVMLATLALAVRHDHAA